MQTIDYLFDPANAGLFWPGVLTGLLVAVLGAVLSVFVVLKRLAFIGQGISHAAFGGVGLSFALGFTGAMAGAAAGEALLADLGLFGVVLLFSVGAALGISWLSDRPATQPDTAIGIVLAAAMAVGFMLYRVAGEAAGRAGRPAPPGLEAVLFGDILIVGWVDVVAALAASAVVLGSLWWWRRPLLFWAFDEQACPAFGVNARRMKNLLLILLSVAVVITMKLAGIVLATALFVLPAATALQLSDRFGRVLLISIGCALLGVVGGVVLSFELDRQTGPSIVVVMALLFASARLGAWAAGRRGRAPARAAAG